MFVLYVQRFNDKGKYTPIANVKSIDDAIKVIVKRLPKHKFQHDILFIDWELHLGTYSYFKINPRASEIIRSPEFTMLGIPLINVNNTIYYVMKDYTSDFAEFDKYIKSVFPDKETCEYTMKYLGTSLTEH